MTHVRSAAIVCQAASILLQYPGETVRAQLPLVRSGIGVLPAGRARECLASLLDHVAAAGERELAEQYVATFDRRRRCCLDLTWWERPEGAVSP